MKSPLNDSRKSNIFVEWAATKAEHTYQGHP
jgi:hypothetical protein